LIKTTDDLYNEDFSGIVDAENHGKLGDLISEIKQLGFEIINYQIIQDLPNSSIVMSLMTFKKL
jgi:hypothetical protein